MSNKQPPRPQFGKLLTEAISSVARRKGVNMEIVEQDLAIEVSEYEGRTKPLSFFTIQRWMRGYPPDPQRMEVVIRFCARQGRIPRDLAVRMLNQANCEHMLPILDELYNHHVGEQEPKPIYTNLPRRNPSFRGRDNEMAELFKRLTPESRAPVMVVYGLGGIGKTTLVTEAGHACLPGGEANFTSTYEAVVFTSARDRTLTLTNVLDDIGRVLEHPVVLRHPANEKMPLVQNLLRRFQTLLIIDNFETIDDLDLTRFALEGVPAPSKVLITTRDYHPTLWPGTWPIQLKSLNDAEALQLVREWAQDHELEAVMTASDAGLEPLLRATEGNPYALLTALGLIAYQKQPLATVLHGLWEGRGQIFDYIFQQAWTLITENEQRLLITMPLFVSSVSHAAISAAADIDSYFLTQGLGRLMEMSLIETDSIPAEQRRYRVHPLTRAFAAARLRENADFEQTARQRQTEYYIRLSTQYEDDWESLPNLDEEIANVLDCAQWCLQASQTRLVANLTAHLWEFYYNLGLWDEYKNLATYAAKACRALGEQALLKKSLHGLAAIAYFRNQPDECEQFILEEKQIAEDMGDMKAVAQAYQNLGQIADLRGQYDLAEQYLQQALEIAQKAGFQRRIITILFNWADVAVHSGQLSKAREILEKGCLEWDREIVDREVLHRLAHVVRLQGDTQRAYSLMTERQESPHLSRWLYALARKEYAELEATVGNFAKALIYAREARDWFTRLGIEDKRDEVQADIEQWQKALESGK